MDKYFQNITRFLCFTKKKLGTVHNIGLLLGTNYSETLRILKEYLEYIKTDEYNSQLTCYYYIFGNLKNSENYKVLLIEESKLKKNLVLFDKNVNSTLFCIIDKSCEDSLLWNFGNQFYKDFITREHDYVHFCRKFDNDINTDFLPKYKDKQFHCNVTQDRQIHPSGLKNAELDIFNSFRKDSDNIKENLQCNLKQSKNGKKSPSKLENDKPSKEKIMQNVCTVILLENGNYNKLIKPDGDNGTALIVWLGLSLSQIIDVFGSWSYDGLNVDIHHMSFLNSTKINSSFSVEMEINLNNFYRSSEWDLLRVDAQKNEKYYTCCIELYPDITFNITIRQKALFYTVNMIIPCVSMSFLTVLVFYLPSQSGEKISLCISILFSLTVFFLMLSKIIPPTFLVVPLIGKYLLFTIIIVTLSIVATVIVINIHFRSPTLHNMHPWIKKKFLKILPRLLGMKLKNFKSLSLSKFTRPRKTRTTSSIKFKNRVTKVYTPSVNRRFINRLICSKNDKCKITRNLIANSFSD
ncbi:hypothetical protein A3Q56_03990 [Intoshia linei]|uniref:Uncharacterized protein n=1 Tax=Intoshia linei TaxID=1819745 RepID=A0A177B3F1_9BILA|nr:hypothetical protein A3Q56_03990 [Intoshia linei]